MYIYINPKKDFVVNHLALRLLPKKNFNYICLFIIIINAYVMF